MLLSPPKLPISLVVITKDEEANIARCLRSVPFADDIVVLDSGSTDQTLAIAQSLGARTFTEPWPGYRAQKIRAAQLARHDWIFSLDADEAMAPQTAENVYKFFKFMMEQGELELCDAFEFARLSFHLGRWIRHGGWYPDRQIRLYHRGRAQWVAGQVHERVQADRERVRRIEGDLWHFPFGSLAGQVETNNEYSTLAALDLAARGQYFSVGKLIFKPIGKFLETYLIKQGFRDGLPGFIIAVGAAYSMFMKWAKLAEKQNKWGQQP